MDFERERIGVNELKQLAREYYSTGGDGEGVMAKMEEVLNSMFYDKPVDVFGHLANYFAAISEKPTIEQLCGRVVVDSRCHLAVEVCVYCTVRNRKKFMSSATVSSVAAGADEREEATSAKSVETAVELINNTINSSLCGSFTEDQDRHDNLLTEVIQKLGDEQQLQAAESPAVDAEVIVPESPAKGKKSPPKGKSKAPAVAVIADEPAETMVVGCEAVCTVSRAVCMAAAHVNKRHLFDHIAYCHVQSNNAESFQMPVPMVTVLMCGKSGTGKLRCVKEFMVVPTSAMPIHDAVQNIVKIYNCCAKTVSAKATPQTRVVNDVGALCPPFDRPEQGIDLLHEAITSLGLTPGVDFHIALNCAGHEAFDFEKGKYDVAVGSQKTAEDWVKYWVDLLSRYPSVIALVDPMRKQDGQCWMSLAESVSARCFIVGDQVYHRAGRLRSEQLSTSYKTSAVVLCQQSIDTVTDLLAAAQLMRDADNEIIVGCRSSENCDTFIADLAVGCRARFVKLGAPVGMERVTKLNRLVQIESILKAEYRLLVADAAYTFTTLTQPPAVDSPSDPVPPTDASSPVMTNDVLNSTSKQSSKKQK